MGADLKILGITAPSGIRYVGISSGADTAWLPQSVFSAGDRVFVPALAVRNRHLIDKKEIEAFKGQLARLTDFPPGIIVEAPGWNGDVFALHNGTTFGADANLYIPIAFDVTANKNMTAGTKEGWLTQVATPLAAQPLGAFLMSAMFVPFLQRFMPQVANFAIEVIGPEGIGKSTLLQAASSVFGATGIDGPHRFWESFATGVDALPKLIAAHRDHPLILDEANVLFASPDRKASATAYALLAHDLGRRETARGSLHAVASAYRGLVVLASNESLQTMAGMPPIAGDQIITLVVPSAWKHGVFVKIPKRYADGGAFAEALSTAASRHHGLAAREFLRRLTADMAKDRSRLQRRLDLWQDKFLKMAGVDRNIGKELRTARAFAAVYAAGKLATRYKILPRSYRCRTAMLTCYQLHRDATAPDIPFRDRLEALIASGSVVAVSDKDDAEQAQRVREAIGTLHEKGSYRELRIPPDRIRTAFRDWDRLKGTAAVKEVLVGEKGKRGQDKSKARLAPSFPKERLYCFRLPPSERSMFDRLSERTAERASSHVGDGGDKCESEIE